MLSVIPQFGPPDLKMGGGGGPPGHPPDKEFLLFKFEVKRFLSAEGLIGDVIVVVSFYESVS